MDNYDKLTILTVLALFGIGFSGYLTYYTFSTNSSGCELKILGLPSCFYGLIVYTLVLIFSASIFRTSRNKLTAAMTAVATVGVGFSGILTLYILTIGPVCKAITIYGVPPCVMGLIMYAVLLVLALALMRKQD